MGNDLIITWVRLFFMLISTEHKNQHAHNVKMLINVKVPTIVCILTFISMVNKISESLIARSFISALHVDKILAFSRQKQ